MNNDPDYREIKLDIDYERLARAICPDQPEVHSIRSSDNILRIVQILALVGAAVWGLYIYISFEQHKQDLSLELLRSQNAQAELQAAIAELSIRKSNLEVERGSIELDSLSQKKVDPEQELSLIDLGPFGDNGDHLYSVDYRYSLTNRGSSRLEITYSTVEVYQAAVSLEAGRGVFEVNDIDVSGSIKWIHRLSRAYYYTPKWRSDISFAIRGGPIKPELGGGATSGLDAGQASRGSLELLVVGKPSDWIGVSTNIGVDGGKVPEDRFELSYTAGLFEANPANKGLHGKP